jgi:predicted RNA-binding Zn-ribbon protein involved in translation (DUF1610 family)
MLTASTLKNARIVVQRRFRLKLETAYYNGSGRVTMELFKLDCHQCGHTVEIAAASPHKCPNCGAAIVIEWEDGRENHCHRGRHGRTDSGEHQTAAIRT